MTDSRTTELREKLTERGIEYETNDHMGAFETSWRGFTATQISANANLIMAVTPEQAIAATLENDPYDAVSCEHVISPDTLHLILDEWDVHPGWTATNENMAQLLGQAAATLGGGECEFVVVKELIPGIKQRGDICECSNCGYRCPYGLIEDERFKCCPRCGSRIKAVKR